ncbi:MAG: maleylacetate reductase [Alphaproteobacteria bacterium]|nr:maleylacetate reductase [Alphaproteobacteria bacterium]
MINPGAFNYVQIDRVVYGQPAAASIVAEAERLGATNVFLLVGGHLNRDTDEVEKVRRALANRFAGLFDRMPAHTPRDAVLAASDVARSAKADLIVAFGGGSVVDAGKMIQICLRHGIRDMDGFEPFRTITQPDGSLKAPPMEAPLVRQISVPTTLSAGEFSPNAGCTDPRGKLKQSYRHPLLAPRAVILDAAPTVHTPEWLWLSTGIRALDHCVEALSSLKSNPYCDGTAMQGLRLLGEGLPAVKRDGGDLDARLKCQIGAWLSMTAVQAGVPMGASHGIGHVLGGTCGVPHGYTSCVMLPNVLRYNKPVNADRQRLVSEALGRPNDDAGDVVGDFIAALDLPRRLADVNVGPDQFQLVADNAMHDRWIHTNPRPIRGPDDVRDILAMAA